MKALQYSMSESDQLNSTNNTGNTFISLDQASTIMADQTQGGNHNSNSGSHIAKTNWQLSKIMHKQ